MSLRRDAICEAKASESDADWPRRRLILSFHWRRCESLFVHLAGACLEAFGRLPESHPSESTFAPRRITRSDFIYWLSSRVIGIAREDGGKDDDHIIFCISNIHGIRQVSNLALATAWYRIVAYFVDTLKLWKSRYFFGRRITNFYFWSISSFWVTPCLFEFTTCLTLHFFKLTGLLKGTAWKMANLRLKVSIKEKNERGQEVELVCKVFQFKPQVRYCNIFRC